MNQEYINQNNNYSYSYNYNYNFEDEEDNDDEGILAKTGNMLSSLFVKVKNTINPFKSNSYVNNPYDLNSTNDPCNQLKYIESINNNSNSNHNNNNLYLTSSSVQNRIKNNQQMYENNNSTVYLGDNNYENYENIYSNNINNHERNGGINQEEDSYFSVEDLCKVSPHLKNEIFKDIQRPSYIPNEQIFQESKKYVYENLVKNYKILKPKINEKNFGESVILLAIQLVNKYNIDAHYEFLVNQKKCNYKLFVNVPEIIKKYYTNKAKVLFYKDLNESSESISHDLNKELLNKFSNGLFNDEKIQNEIVEYSSKKFVCRTPKTKRNYITSLFENNFNYDYLCPNDKVKCQIYKECLIYRENELRNYSKVIEVTNNMFKFICNENEKLKDEINQKNKKIETYENKIMLEKINKKDINLKIKDYENKISNLSNNQKKNKFENLQKSRFTTNYIVNKGNNLFNQTSSNFSFDSNKNNRDYNKSNVLNLNQGGLSLFHSPQLQYPRQVNTITKEENSTVENEQDKNKYQNVFTFGNKRENLKSDTKNNIFSSNSLFSNNKKDISNNNDSSLFLNLNSQINNQTQEKSPFSEVGNNITDTQKSEGKINFGFLNKDKEKDNDDNKK